VRVSAAGTGERVHLFTPKTCRPKKRSTASKQSEDIMTDNIQPTRAVPVDACRLCGQQGLAAEGTGICTHCLALASFCYSCDSVVAVTIGANGALWIDVRHDDGCAA
jgi:hypothetical protein